MQKRISSLNIVPLVDVLLVLLVILLLIMPAMQKQLTVQVPEGQASAATDTKILTLVVRADGRIFEESNQVELSPAAVLHKISTEKQVNLAVDHTTPFERVTPVMELLQQKNITSVNFLVK